MKLLSQLVFCLSLISLPSVGEEQPSCNIIQTLSTEFALADYSFAWIENGRINSCVSDVNLTQIPFEAASLSKPVFSVIVLKLIDAGRFTLDTKLQSLVDQTSLPERFKYLYATDEFSALTVKSILSHQSGLPNWRGDKPLAFIAPPLSQFTYSGEAFELLQAIVENHENTSLEALAQRHIFKPLEMLNTSFTAARYTPVTGTNNVGKPLPLSQTTAGSAAFSLLTTASDYLTFLTALVSGELLSGQSYKALTQMYVKEKDDYGNAIHWGLGVVVEDTPDGKILAHTGSNPGFRAFAIIDVGAKSGMVYLSNSDRGSVIDQRLFAKYGKLSQVDGFYQWLECHQCDLMSQWIYQLNTSQKITDNPALSFDEKAELAYAFAEAGNTKLAFSLFALLDTLKPDHIEISYGKAVVYLRESQFASAQREFSKVLALNPDAHNAKLAYHGIATLNGTKGRRFFIPGFADANSVFLRGDFNHWNRFSLPMKKVAGGWLRFVQHVSLGDHYTFQVDNQWITDPSSSAVFNRFGKQVSILDEKHR